MMNYNPDTGNYEWNDAGSYAPPPSGQEDYGPAPGFEPDPTLPTYDRETGWGDPAPTGYDQYGFPNDPNKKPADTATHTWVWVNNRWQQEFKGDLPAGGGWTGGDGGGGGGGGESAPAASAPSFGGGSVASNVSPAPAFNAPRYKSPGAFKDYFKAPAPFVAPDKTAIYDDPGYQARFDAGERAIKNAASASRMSRTGPTWKGLSDYAQGMASQEYGQVYGRRSNEYDRTYENAFKESATNYGFLFDDADRQFKNDLAAAGAEYQPEFATWEAQTGRDWQNSLLDWQKEQYGSDSEYRNNSLIASILESIFASGRRTV